MSILGEKEMTDLSLHILDLAHNAFAAQATQVEITIVENSKTSEMVITIEDNGSGIEESKINHIKNPFFTSRTTRKIGLGVPLFVQTCEQTEGYATIKSKPGIKTEITGKLYTNHIDAIPLGEMEETVFLLMAYSPKVNIIYKHRYNSKEFIVSTKQLFDEIEVSLTNYEIVKWIKEYIRENICQIRGGIR